MKLLPLEALRVIASFYVVLHHSLYTFELLEQKSFFWYFFNFGQEAVIVFFILSGFVISQSLVKHDYTFKVYFLHRFTRIYIMVIVAYLISYLCLIITLENNQLNIEDVVLNLLMLQDKAMFRPGTFVSPLFNNEPLWSLSFEWWFYMIFFFHYYVQQKYKISMYSNIKYAYLLSVFGMITFYLLANQISTFLMYYIVWFSGVVILYDVQNHTTKYLKNYLMYFMLFVALYSVLFTAEVPYVTSVVHPFITLRHFISLMIFLFLFLFLQKYIYRLVQIKLIEKIIKFLSIFAPISFAIYILHYPIMTALNSFNLPASIKFLLLLLLTLSLSYVVERLLYPFFKKYLFKYFNITKDSK